MFKYTLILAFVVLLYGCGEDSETPEETPTPSGSLVGTWLATNVENELLVFSFFEDGTYLHAEIDLNMTAEQLEYQNSGMEWGTYTRDNSTGEMTSFSQYFDGNGDIGASSNDLDIDEVIFTVFDDNLTLTTDEDRNGTVDFEIDFVRVSSDDFVGSWVATNSGSDFLQLIFFDDGTYLHAEVDFNMTAEELMYQSSGMEWGTYTRDSSTGKITAVSQNLDNNGEIGFSDGSPDTDDIIFIVSGDEMTLTVDEDRNNVLETELDFVRN